jgi:hypothetical protein
MASEAATLQGKPRTITKPPLRNATYTCTLAAITGAFHKTTPKNKRIANVELQTIGTHQTPAAELLTMLPTLSVKKFLMAQSDRQAKQQLLPRLIKQDRKNVDTHVRAGVDEQTFETMTNSQRQVTQIHWTSDCTRGSEDNPRCHCVTHTHYLRRKSLHHHHPRRSFFERCLSD